MPDMEAMILELAEDDYTGLWEFVWSAGAIGPQVEGGTLLSSLRVALLNLLAAGKIRLYRGRRFSGEEKLVASSEVESLIAKTDSWEPPELNGVHLRVLAI